MGYPQARSYSKDSGNMHFRSHSLGHLFERIRKSMPAAFSGFRRVRTPTPRLARGVEYRNHGVSVPPAATPCHTPQRSAGASPTGASLGGGLSSFLAV